MKAKAVTVATVPAEADTSTEKGHKNLTVGFVAEPELVARIDAYCERLHRETEEAVRSSGISVFRSRFTRAQSLRSLTMLGLAVADIGRETLEALEHYRQDKGMDSLSEALKAFLEEPLADVRRKDICPAGYPAVELARE